MRGMMKFLLVVGFLLSATVSAESSASSFLRFLRSQGYTRPNAQQWPTMFMRNGLMFFLDNNRQMQPVNLNPTDGRITIGNQRFFSPYVDNSVVNYFRSLRGQIPQEQWQQLGASLGARVPQFWQRVTGEQPTAVGAPLPLPGIPNAGQTPTLAGGGPNHLGGGGFNPAERPSSATGLVDIKTLFRSRDATALATCQSSDGNTLQGVVSFQRDIQNTVFKNLPGQIPFSVGLTTAPLQGATPSVGRTGDGRVNGGFKVGVGVTVGSSTHFSDDGTIFRDVRELTPPVGREFRSLEVRQNPQTGRLQLTDVNQIVYNNGTVRNFVKVCQLGQITEHP